MIEIECVNMNNDDMVSALADTKEPVLLKGYESDEVVTVTNENIHSLRYKGYIIDKELKVGDTYILTRKSCILYHVKPLEKLSDIAYKFSKTTEQIMQDNNLTSQKLFIGQILVIY